MERLVNDDDMVRLLIRAPDQQIDDHIVNCQLDWTVAKLKDHLSEFYPSKPKRVDQKIIFSGHLLADEMALKEVLQQHYTEAEKTFIIHLVCPIMSKPSRPSQSPTANPPSSTTTTTSTQASPIQQYYGQLNNQQMAWMQQAYAHYLTQYMQLMAAQGVQIPSQMPYTQAPNSSADVPNLLNNVSNTTNRTNNAENEEQAAQGDINPVQNNNNNNLGDDNEAGANRDWLDVFDMLARLLVLSSIVYFYSSPSRFLIVTFLGFAIYLIQGGFFRAQRYLADNNNAENNAANEPAGGQPQENIQPGDTSEQQEARTTNVTEERPGALAFTWTFLSSFFASLIPEQPPVI